MEIELDLNKTIAIASTGLATSGVTASILSAKISQYKISVPNTFLLSFGFGIAVALIVSRFFPRS